ncbi:unnamed protein product [Caenorhabditis brenneri]
MPCRLPFFSPFHSLRIKKYMWMMSPPPPKGFSLLKLPHFPLKNIVNQLELVDVIELTLVSTKFKNAVSSVKYIVNYFEVLLGTYTNRVKTCVFERGDIANEYFEIETLRCNFEDRPVWIRRKLDGEHFLVTKTYRDFDSERSLSQSKSQVFVSENQELVVLEKIVRHLLSILDAKVTVRINKQYEKPKELFIWKYIQKLEFLEIQMIGDFDGVGTWELPEGCGWKDFDVYPSHIKCRALEFQLDGVPYQEVNRMFKEWMSGKLRNIEQICFRFPSRPDDRNFDPIFEGLNAVPTTFSRALITKRQVYGTTYPSPPMDIRRATDDLKATIIVAKQNVAMYVWHQKFLGAESDEE